MKPLRDKSVIAKCAMFCVLFEAIPVLAVDVSTHSFSNCAFPDTGQITGYTATFGEDNDYNSSASKPRYTIYNPVGISSVTVDDLTGHWRLVRLGRRSCDL